MNPSAEAWNETFALDPDGFASNIEKALNASYSPMLQKYKCGNINTFVESSGIESEPGLDVLLDSRNEQMAAKIDEVLKASDPTKKITFAVGTLHWLSGNKTMISLLEDYGYSMEHIPYWNSTQLENPSDEYCGVIYNPETGIFVADSSIGVATSDTAPSPSSEGETVTTSPTMSSQEAVEKEVAPESASTARHTTAGVVTMMIGWSSYMLNYI